MQNAEASTVFIIVMLVMFTASGVFYIRKYSDVVDCMKFSDILFEYFKNTNPRIPYCYLLVHSV